MYIIKFPFYHASSSIDLQRYCWAQIQTPSRNSIDCLLHWIRTGQMHFIFKYSLLSLLVSGQYPLINSSVHLNARRSHSAAQLGDRPLWQQSSCLPTPSCPSHPLLILWLSPDLGKVNDKIRHPPPPPITTTSYFPLSPHPLIPATSCLSAFDIVAVVESSGKLRLLLIPKEW